jgi:hypothetical protein
MQCEERLSEWIDFMRGLVSRVINPVGDGISLLSNGLLTKRTAMGLDNHCAIVLFRDREQAMADFMPRWAATTN